MMKQTTLELKKTNRFSIEFHKPFEDIKSWALRDTKRPKYVNGDWDLIEIILHDPIGDFYSTSKALMSGVSYYDNKKRLDNMIINYDLFLFDPTGVKVEKWNIKGNIISLDFGELSYETDEIVEIKILIQPTKVILQY